MLFNSPHFLLFLPVVWALYVLLKHRYQNILLLLASYFFYGCWDWRFLGLLWVSTIVDFISGIAMVRYGSKRLLFLIVSLATNLGILGTFKYFDFFTQSAAGMLETLGLQPDFVTLGLVLPVGISFYTFQTMAYSIDVYRGRQKPTTNLLHFAIYVAYFPQLVAGPIERTQHLLPQIKNKRTVRSSDIFAGIQLCIMGYFKKVFIADGVGSLVDRSCALYDALSATGLLITAYLFALQIYGDFSGYSDIARGVSRFFGIRLRVNFAQPYLSSNITEFWCRWHISLSAWLRDYLYIPLGGNRKGKFRTYLNNFLTMLLGGLWHGASWNFVIWGGMHGSYLTTHKASLRGEKVELNAPPRKMIAFLKWSLGCLLTFNLVCLTWIFFRAESLSQASSFIFGLLTLKSGEVSSQLAFAYLIFYGSATLLLDSLCYFQQSELPFQNKCPPIVRGLAYAVMLFLVVSVGENHAPPFIYFQF
ncbi:MAG: MBOAT family O-acyltransferase [Planctomycetota bacterium]|nr:MBOAT family O-acyltransferase [Planctomycetota bacterium]